MSMTFGYKSFDKRTEQEGGMEVRGAACWAPLKIPQEQVVITEITWVPNRGESEHTKLLLPALFPDVKYVTGKKEFPNIKGGEKFFVTFTGLEDVYRNNFMFRMFIIRNIDRDDNQKRSFEYLHKQKGVNLLEAAAVAANLNTEAGGWGANAQWALRIKGYASCFGPSVTVADVKAFARDPEALRNKKDWKFGEGRGFGYGGAQDNNTNGRANYYPSAMHSTCTGYKPSRPQFRSITWNPNNVTAFLVKLFGAKVIHADVAKEISQVRITK